MRVISNFPNQVKVEILEEKVIKVKGEPQVLLEVRVRIKDLILSPSVKLSYDGLDSILIGELNWAYKPFKLMEDNELIRDLLRSKLRYFIKE